MYSTYNKGESVFAKRIIRTLNNKIYKYVTSISKKCICCKLYDIVNKYNNTYHRTITMKPTDVKSKNLKSEMYIHPSETIFGLRI